MTNPENKKLQSQDKTPKPEKKGIVLIFPSEHIGGGGSSVFESDDPGWGPDPHDRPRVPYQPKWDSDESIKEYPPDDD
jgi:hypothetical protein